MIQWKLHIKDACGTGVTVHRREMSAVSRCHSFLNGILYEDICPLVRGTCCIEVSVNGGSVVFLIKKIGCTSTSMGSRVHVVVLKHLRVWIPPIF